MKSWKARLLALFTVVALLTSIAGPAMAGDRDDCRRFHGDLYCEVDRGDRFDNEFFFFDPFFYYYYFNPFFFGCEGPVCLID